MAFLKWCKSRWGVVLLSLILLVIILLNVKPGFVILGNDNFSPELNPTLSLNRSIFAPGWRTYRVEGIPSDSEQADVFRTAIFYVAGTVLPQWFLSQGYLFFTFFIASFSMGGIVALFAKKTLGKESEQAAFFLGGLFYLCSMLTSWVYFFPVHLFVAAYAFLPFVIWRMGRFFAEQNTKNAVLLLVASLFLSTAALTATMFLVCSFIILIFAGVFFVQGRQQSSVRTLAIALLIVLGIQAYWALPFASYVKSNTAALRDSAINREITSTTIENEARNNTWVNALRYYASWMDTKENNRTYTFTYREWYKKSPVALLLSIIPILFALVGSAYIVKKKQKAWVVFPIVAFAGWYFIKGINPPLGEVYTFFQDHFPIAAQVLRWQSSKLWPLLALFVPLLASVGVLWILGFGRAVAPSVGKSDPRREMLGKWGKPVGIVIVSLMLLSFVFPYFKGELVRNKVYVQVPNEYFSLGNYLDKTDKFSRIYLSPEANTLYFRNYDWGFWGSVVLNYILPNPIIEKALTIGSYENEQAFTVISNAYYSEDPLNFVHALRIYNTEYVLSDRHAATGEAGYAYNWDIEKKVVENNPELQKVWEKGKLTLYKLKPLVTSSTLAPMSSQSDFTRLNTILATHTEQSPYYSDPLVAGTIYPFALQFSSVSFVPRELIAETIYSGPQSSYEYSVKAEDFLASPTQITYSQGSTAFVASPTYPYIRVNDATYSYQLPTLTYSLKERMAFLTLGEQVIDERNITQSRATHEPFGFLTTGTAISAWHDSYVPLDLLNAPKSTFYCSNTPKTSGISVAPKERVKCGSDFLPVAKDTLMEVEVRFTTTSPVQSFLCIESQIKRSCLNKNISAFTSGIGEFSVLIPTLLQRGDSIKVYMDFEGKGDGGGVVNIEKMLLKYYDNSETPALTDATAALPQQSFIAAISPKDTIALHIPILEGGNSFPFTSNGILIPEASATAFEDGLPYASSITISPENGLEIKNKESNSSIYPKLSFLDPRGGIAFVAMHAKNNSGVPVEVSMRDTNKPYKLWSRRIWYKADTTAIDIFRLPDAIRTYYFEAFSTGLGPRFSDNTINALLFQIIPQSWYNMALVPAAQTFKDVTELKESDATKDTNSYKGFVPTELVSIPTAKSPNWQLTIGGQKTGIPATINGWKQAWSVKKTGNAAVLFSPNFLVYMGYGILLLVIIGIFVYVGRGYVREYKKVKKKIQEGSRG